MFAPHTFATTVTGCPKVILTKQAYHDMAILVQEVSTEVGWLATVRKEGNSFIVERVFVPKQEVGAATAEITGEGVAELCEELLADPNGMELINSLRFWGHSHVNMGTGPSGQDDTQMALFRENGCEWFVRGILNKHRKAQFDVYYFALGFTFLDVAWELEGAEDDTRRTFWKTQIENKVSPIRYAPLPPYKSAHQYPGGGGCTPPYERGVIPRQKTLVDMSEEDLEKTWDSYLKGNYDENDTQEIQILSGK